MSERGRVALVTGANRGIGLEIVRQLAARGIRVILTARDLGHAMPAAQTLADEKLDVTPRLLDVTDQARIDRLVREVEAEFGRLDILVNNAGILIDRDQRGATVDLELVRATLDTNLFGPWRTCKAFIPLMRRNGYGRIVNVSSGSGAFEEMAGTRGYWPAYSVSKASLNALTVVLASELRGENILINAACPGWVRTDMGGPGALRSVGKGAETPVWLATLPDKGPTGGFFRDRRPIKW